MSDFNLYKEIFHPTWIEPLREAGCLDQLDSIIPHMDILYENSIVYPIKEQVFRVFQGDYHDVKVILLGQDPYHSVHNGKPDACGLSFLTENGYVPPSLHNMYTELANDIPGVIGSDSKDYNFTKWIDQGVIMLNTALTVEAGRAGSHILIWHVWTQKLIKYLTVNRQDIVWILLGRYAEKALGNYECRKIIAAHPSPLAGGRFFGSRIYSKTNELLTKKINW